MSKVFDTLTGAGRAEDAARDAAAAAQLQPFAVQTPFGEANINQGQLFVGASPGAGLAPGFEQLAQGFLGQLGAAGPLQTLGLTPDQLAAAGLTIGSDTAGGFLGQGQQFLAGAGDLLSSIGSFDPAAFARQRFTALEELAAPGEAQAAESLANRLFAAGRVGGEDTAGGRAFGELAQAQARARTERGLLSQAAASQELTQRIAQAGSLAGTGAQLGLQGEQIASSELGRFLSGVQAGGQQQVLQQAGLESLLSLAGGATGGIMQAFAPSQAAIQALLAGSNLQQGGQQAAAGFIQQGGQAGAQGFGNLTGSIISGLFGLSDPRLKEDVTVVGSRDGLTVYEWTWNEEAQERYGLDGRERGFMADEVKFQRPEAVALIDDYIAINYHMLGGRP